MTSLEQHAHLFKPLDLGDGFILPNRIALASLTRNRSNAPDAMKKYYVQRSTAGLVLSEGTLVSIQGTEWPHAPTIHRNIDIEMWKEIVDVVHSASPDAKFFCQLWHVGRIAHPKLQDHPVEAVSDVAARGGSFKHVGVEEGYVAGTPVDDPKTIVADFRRAAENAKKAGFDGVEFHSANGYLPAQFLESHSNKRTDSYGGSVENRIRFNLECLRELIDVFGSRRVGMKISPAGGYNDSGEANEHDVVELYGALLKEVNKLKLGYVQIVRWAEDMDPKFDDKLRSVKMDTIGALKGYLPDVHILGNMNYDPDEAEKDIATGFVDGVVFGRTYIGNPDLPERIKEGKILNDKLNYKAFYQVVDGDVEKGYSDYPTAT